MAAHVFDLGRVEPVAPPILSQADVKRACGIALAVRRCELRRAMEDAQDNVRLSYRKAREAVTGCLVSFGVGLLGVKCQNIASWSPIVNDPPIDIIMAVGWGLVGGACVAIIGLTSIFRDACGAAKREKTALRAMRRAAFLARPLAGVQQG